MQLQLKAKHFIGTEYQTSKEGCAIEKALREMLPNEEIVVVGTGRVFMGRDFDEREFRMTNYFLGTFEKDKEKAYSMQPEEIVRIIDIPELEMP